MKIRFFLTSFGLLLITLPGCGRGVDTHEQDTSFGDALTSPAPSFVLEKVTDRGGWIIYERQELTPDSVFYLAIDAETGDTVEQWREARIPEQEVEMQVLSMKGHARMLWHDLVLLFKVNEKVYDETN